MGELWKDIRGYEGLYKISNLGRVANNTKILKQILCKDGYMRIHLYKNGVGKHVYVHRLVAEAFIQNRYDLPEVNHVDKQRNNNRVSNLEWCTKQQNMTHGKGKKIQQIKLNGTILSTYESTAQAGRALKVDSGNISRCASGSCATAYGFVWRYRDE